MVAVCCAVRVACCLLLIVWRVLFGHACLFVVERCLLLVVWCLLRVVAC